MARRLTTGFELGEVAENNGVVVQNTGGLVISTEKRTGNYCWRALNSTPTTLSFNYFSQVFSDDPDELYMRYAYRCTAGNPTSLPNMMWALKDGGGNCHLALGINSLDLIPVLYQGGGGVLGQTAPVAIGTATKNLQTNRWAILEVQAKIDSAAGTCVVKLNNTTILSFTGDTSAGTDAIRTLEFGARGATTGEGLDGIYYDDIAVNDTTGNYENTWPGLGGVFLLKPTAEGATTTWDTSTGTAHYELVDDVPANTTDWIQALDTGEIDLFELEDAPTYVNQINLVEVMYQAAVAESGYNIMTDVLRDGTVNYTDGTSTVVSIAPGYDLYKGTAYYRRPADGTTAWGTADVNALQAGVQIL